MNAPRLSRVCCALLLPAGSLPCSATVLQEIAEKLPSSSTTVVTASSQTADTANAVVTNQPTRGGNAAFRHILTKDKRASEITAQSTPAGSTRWYGWSMQIPRAPASTTSVMSLAASDPRFARPLSCGRTGTHLACDAKGRLTFHLHHPADANAEPKCDEFVIAPDLTKNLGQWVDLVLHAQWTDQPDGFVELWVKLHDNNFFQRVNFQGRTWWNKEGAGPEFRMGASRDTQATGNDPEIVVFTDELRIGDAGSNFDEVAAPGQASRAREAGRGQIRYTLYPSALNRSKIPIMVYTPPGYDPAATKRYPVVYNLHGAGGGSPARQWSREQQTLTAAMDAGTVPPTIVVFVNGQGDTGYIDIPAPNAPKVYSSIVTELIPFIDANYRTVADRRGRAVDGFSMGGGGSMMLALKRPDLFSAVVSYAGGFIKAPPDGAPDPKAAQRRELLEQFGHWNLVQRNHEAIRSGLRIRMVCGDQDQLHPVNIEFKDFLLSREIPVTWISIPGVAHDTKGLFDRVGVESLKFMHEGFAQP